MAASNKGDRLDTCELRFLLQKVSSTGVSTVAYDATSGRPLWGTSKSPFWMSLLCALSLGTYRETVNPNPVFLLSKSKRASAMNLSRSAAEPRRTFSSHSWQPASYSPACRSRQGGEADCSKLGAFFQTSMLFAKSPPYLCHFPQLGCVMKSKQHIVVGPTTTGHHIQSEMIVLYPYK